MRKPNNLDKKYLMIITWIAINSVIGLIVALILSIGISEPFIRLLAVSQIFTHLTASFAAIAGYGSGYLIHDKPTWLTILIVTPVSIAGSLFGIFLSLFISKWFEYLLMQQIVEKLILPALVITVLINIITVLIETFKFKRTLMIQELNNLKHKISEIENYSKKDTGFDINENGYVHKLNFSDIIYLSSHGKKCLIHCEQGDYELSKMLKNIEEELPGEIFIRIHKQFIINTNYALKMKYYKGGRYLLYLNDEEESVLPVGGVFTNILRNRLKIS